MSKGTEKCSPCMLSRQVVHLGILKWTRMRESNPSILKLDKILSHLRIDGWKCLKTKLVKQRKQPNGTVQSVKLMFIFMHPQFAMDGTILNVLASKHHQNPCTSYVISLRLGFRRHFLSVLHPNLVSSPIKGILEILNLTPRCIPIDILAWKDCVISSAGKIS